jgi:hypothetical protein
VKGACLFCQMRGYLLRGVSREHGADGLFVLREVALNCGQIEGAKDAGVGFPFEEEREGLFDQLLCCGLAFGELLQVFGGDGYHVRGGRPV